MFSPLLREMAIMTSQKNSGVFRNSKISTGTGGGSYFYTELFSSVYFNCIS
jgi:hypothetical protein